MNEQIKQRITQLNNGEVPSGYEKTEFGIFPCDWVKDKKFKDLGTFGKGKGLPGDKMTSEGVPCVGYGDIYMKYNHFHFKEAQTFVDEETAFESQPIEKGTLLFTGTGETADEIGKCVCYNGDETIYAGGDIITFVSDKVNPLFLAYQQYQEFSLRKKASYSQGHSVVHIQRENLEKLNVAYPQSAEEQSKIAEILMKWDEAIELQEHYIENCEKIKRVLLKRLFVFSEEEHSTVRLKDAVVSMSSGGTPLTSKNEYFDGGIVWVSIDDITKCEKYIVDSARKLTIAGINNSSAKVFPIGTILYAMYASIGKCAIAKVECSTSQAILGIVTDPSILDAQYLYYYLCSIQENIATQGQQGTQSNLNKKMVESFQIPVPVNEHGINLEKQKNISDTLICADNMISVHKSKLEKLKKQRKALQQYLLNGIVRV